MNINKYILAGALLSFTSIQAHGAIVNELLPNTHNWRVFYDTNEITNFSFSSTSENQGVLTFTSVFTATSYPHVLDGPGLSFIQDASPLASSFGLVLVLNNTVINNTGFAMSGLEFGLVETSTNNGAGTGSTAHPGYAHFHALSSVGCTDTELFNPFTTGGSSNTFDPICNPTVLGKTINVSGGAIPNEATANFSQFRLHETEISNQIRVFSFYEVPTLIGPVASIPEPLSMALLGFGMVGIAVARSCRYLSSESQG